MDSPTRGFPVVKKITAVLLALFLLAGITQRLALAAPPDDVIVDPVLKRVINRQLAMNEAGRSLDAKISAEDMERLNYGISAENSGVTDLEGVQYGINLEVLQLSKNSIKDLSPIGSLQNLEWVVLKNNAIEDVSPLKNMGADEVEIDLSHNQIKDIAPLADMKVNASLTLNANQISDISPLKKHVDAKLKCSASDQAVSVTSAGGKASNPLKDLDGATISELTNLVNLTVQGQELVLTDPSKAGTGEFSTTFGSGRNQGVFSGKITVEPSAKRNFEITKQPENSEVTEGNTATFDVQAVSDDPMSYVWSYSTDQGQTWQPVNGQAGFTAEGAELHVAGKTELNNVQVRVEITSGDKTLISDAATLTVIPLISLEKNPKDVTVTEGESARFEFTVTGEDSRGVFGWEVSQDAGQTWKSSDEVGFKPGSSRTLAIDPTTLQMNGWQFRGFVTYEVNGEQRRLTTDAASLTVQAKPKVILKQSDVSVTAGQPASFEMTVEHAPENYVMGWKLSKDEGKSWEAVSEPWASGTQSNKLTITQTTAQMNGWQFRPYIEYASPAEQPTPVARAATAAEFRTVRLRADDAPTTVRIEGEPGTLHVSEPSPVPSEPVNPPTAGPSEPVNPPTAGPTEAPTASPVPPTSAPVKPSPKPPATGAEGPSTAVVTLALASALGIGWLGRRK